MPVFKLEIVMVALLAGAALIGATGLIGGIPAGERPRAPSPDKCNKAVAKEEIPKSDKDRLQGAWQVVLFVHDGREEENGPAEEQECEMRFEGASVKLKFRVKQTEELTDNVSYRAMRIRLDETTEPKGIDAVEGAVEDLLDTAKFDRRFENANERTEGIYCLEGDTLKICFSEKRGQRPKHFEGKQGSDSYLYVLKKVTEKIR